MRLALLRLVTAHHDHEKLTRWSHFSGQLSLFVRRADIRCHRADRDRAGRDRACRSAPDGDRHPSAINSGTDCHSDAVAEFIALGHAAANDQHRPAFADANPITHGDAADDKYSRAFAVAEFLRLGRGRPNPEEECSAEESRSGQDS